MAHWHCCGVCNECRRTTVHICSCRLCSCCGGDPQPRFNRLALLLNAVAAAVHRCSPTQAAGYDGTVSGRTGEPGLRPVVHMHARAISLASLSALVISYCLAATTVRPSSGREAARWGADQCTRRCVQRKMRVTVNITNVLLVAALLITLAFSGVHLHNKYRSAGDDKLQAAFVLLVGPTHEGENRTRGLEVALHCLWFNYLQEHPRPVYLFIGDDIPADQYTPEIVRAITPPGMHAEAIHVPGFLDPPDNMRTVVLHSIMAGGKYPGQRAFQSTGIVHLPTTVMSRRQI